ncbi:MAG: hypothetical protein ACQEQ0_13485, partial [Bacteroidota bacterium]
MKYLFILLASIPGAAFAQNYEPEVYASEDTAIVRKEVRQSDIIQLIMDLDGVSGIRELRINHCD